MFSFSFLICDLHFAIISVFGRPCECKCVCMCTCTCHSIKAMESWFCASCIDFATILLPRPCNCFVIHAAYTVHARPVCLLPRTVFHWFAYCFLYCLSSCLVKPFQISRSVNGLHENENKIAKEDYPLQKRFKEPLRFGQNA